MLMVIPFVTAFPAPEEPAMDDRLGQERLIEFVPKRKLSFCAKSLLLVALVPMFVILYVTLWRSSEKVYYFLEAWGVSSLSEDEVRIVIGRELRVSIDRIEVNTWRQRRSLLELRTFHARVTMLAKSNDMETSTEKLKSVPSIQIFYVESRVAGVSSNETALRERATKAFNRSGEIGRAHVRTPVTA